MTMLTQEYEREVDVKLREFADLYERLPQEGPLPLTRASKKALARLIAETYGDALRELENH